MRRGRHRSWLLVILASACAAAVAAFETEWTRVWSTVHDGDDPIERELLGRLAHAKGT
jgi:hypothetical protein